MGKVIHLDAYRYGTAACQECDRRLRDVDIKYCECGMQICDECWFDFHEACDDIEEDDDGWEENIYD